MDEIGAYVMVIDDSLHSVLKERVAQDAKWGMQNHHPLEWLAILSEEVGEFAQTLLTQRKGALRQVEGAPHPKRVRAEAVQVAAVALAIVECCDRDNWTGEEP